MIWGPGSSMLARKRTRTNVGETPYRRARPAATPATSLPRRGRTRPRCPTVLRVVVREGMTSSFPLEPRCSSGPAARSGRAREPACQNGRHMAKRLLILGSTGSIGTQALDIVARDPELELVGLSAERSVDALIEQARRFGVDRIALADADAGARAAEAWTDGEVLVVALAEGTGAQILPVDSEHSALHQLLAGERAGSVDRLVLTASGGPFRGRTRAQLADVSVDDALAHPTWDMGGKITIDSATLMNKGLEVIEAHHLFGVGYDRIDVVVHPQSIVHSMITLCDGAALAHLGHPDMRVPISYALHHPNRVDVPMRALDLAEVGALAAELVEAWAGRLLH